MLHAVAARPGQVIGDEGVGVVLERRVLAVDKPHLTDDRLGVTGVRGELVFAAVVMQRDAEDGRAAAVGDGKRAHRERAELRGAVHQVLEVRRGKRLRVRSWKQLRGHTPARALWLLEA